MIRDASNNYNIGFGVSPNDIPGEKRGPDPEGGVFSRRLHDDPVLRFLGVTAATIVGMKIGGDLVRKGGLRLGYKLERSASPIAQRATRQYVKTQKLLDSYQGITRVLDEANDERRLFMRTGKEYRQGSAFNKVNDGYFMRREEIRGAVARGEKPTVAPWRMRDEIQQRMVSQARRLPYELPAAYVTQRAITDPLFGRDDPDKPPVNWYNPVDVVTDFVTQSVKNTAFMIAPFEAGSGATTQSWRKFMSHSDTLMSSGGSESMRTASIGLQAILARMGHDASDIVQKGVRLSAQTTGAFSTAIQESNTGAVGLPRWLSMTRHGMGALRQEERFQQLSTTRKGKELLRSLFSAQGGGSILDQLPGPLKGLNTGIISFKDNYRQIGKGYDFLDELMTGTKTINSKTRSSDIQALHRVVADSSSIGDLSARLASYAGRNGSIRDGDLFQMVLRDEYRKQLTRRLQLDHGLSDDGAKQFAKQFSVSPLRGKEAEIDLSHRVRVGNKPFMVGGSTDDFYNAIYKRTAMFNKAGDAEIVARNLGASIHATDKMFGSSEFLKSIDERVTQTLSHIENVVIPRSGEALFKRAKLPYEDFTGQLTSAQQSFMIRRSAERLGIPTVDPRSGTAIPDHILRSRVQKLGLNPGNTDRMRGFLIHSGDISKPWTKQGRNIFGLKPLEVGTALERGYFKTGTEPEQNIEALVEKLKHADPVSASVGGYSLGGVYQTPSGKIVDFSTLKRKAYRFGDAFAANFQVPLIHFKPLEGLGWNAARDARQRPILEIVPGSSNQAFLGDANKMSDDVYVWLKTRGHKGKVTKVNRTLTGEVDSTLLPYEYKLGDPSAYKIMGKNLRLGLGESGYAPFVGDDEAPTGLGRLVDRKLGKGPREQFKRLFNIDSHQPDSLRHWVERFRNRTTDINNPLTLARLTRDGSINTKKGVLAFGADGGITLGGKAYKSPTEVAEAFGSWAGSITHYGPAPRVIRGLESDPNFKNRFGFTFKELDATSGIGQGTNRHIPLSGMKSNAQVVNYARQVREQIQGDYDSLPDEAKKLLRRAESSLIDSHLKAATDTSFWDQLLPQGMRTSTISTRADKLKTDLYRFLAIHEEVMQSGSFERSLPNLMKKLQDLKSSGKISAPEFTEARTSLLSMQIDFMNYKTFNASQSNATARLNALSQIRGSAVSKELIDDYLTQNFEVTTSVSQDYVRALMRRNLQPAGGSYSGLEYNPFGDTSSVFVPTFGSALQRSGGKAFASVMGLNTWSNPEAYSGASAISSHIIGRLNRPLQTAGLGLDLNAYKGPLDFYARGLVGQRALPFYAAGVSALTIDRTIGGYMHDKDANGERVYSPYVLGHVGRLGVEAQALGSGLMPGGLDYEQRKEQLLEGEVAVRQGRYWLMGNTPLLGGKIQYFRPSWYRRMMAGTGYTDETFGTPMERALYGYDFSPLRPFDPYRYERKTYDTRPYPVTGDYFNGPWGPLTPALNTTIGRLLKPERAMHEEELKEGLSSYGVIGSSGAYQGGYTSTAFGTFANQNVPNMRSFDGARFVSGTSGRGGGGGSALSLGNNASLAAAGAQSLEGAKATTTNTIAGYNYRLIEAAGQPGTMRPDIEANMDPITRGSFSYQASEFGYRAQEMAGIYGFMFGAGREALGFGSQDFSPQRSVLQSSSYAFGSSRGFWEMNLGGAGDLPSPFEGQFGNLEFSEVMRRFIPKERPDVNYVNPIKNEMGRMHPWLPGAGNPQDYTTGDPFSKAVEGELRLPGTTYERLNQLHPDEYGQYGLVDQHKILGGVSPYSQEYREIDRMIDQQPLSTEARRVVETTRAQVAAKSKKYEFHPYEYKYSSADEMGMGGLEFQLRKGVEQLQHAGTYFNTKFVNHNTAVEDWERNHVYGATFPSWNNPISDFIEPTIQQNAQRNPILAGLALGGVARMMAVSRQAKAVAGTLGAITGFSTAAFVQGKEFLTGERHMPEHRLKELAAEEATDILSYVKYQKLANEASQYGDEFSASQFSRQARMTMYGADLENLNPIELANAVPKRKREHFLEMLQAPEQERERILSTAPRLERRLYQAAWGMRVEERPDLMEYFAQHELPAPTAEIWGANTSMADIEIKIAQSMGVDLAQMGYYPQQIAEANLINPSYPDYNRGTSEMDIRNFFRTYNIDADVRPIRRPGAGGNVSVYNGM